MAVALNPTKTLYSIKKSKDEDPVKSANTKYYSDNTNNPNSNSNNINDNIINSNLYADSPSRQLRRSARVASLSPSSFAPLISTGSNNYSGTNSATSSASSYAPASPSRKYSLMKSGKLENEITLDSDSGKAIHVSKKSSFYLHFFLSLPLSLSVPQDFIQV